mmetsp:Transcript_821/g.1763  ORF Transcript_821/g.1763 Transcript_821/m.1763 type:complete len:136 (-) Transcript_821:1224-1631(-)
MEERGVEIVSRYPKPPVQFYKGLRREEAPAPPRPPTHGEHYSMFGSVYTTEDSLPSLEASQREVLYSESKPRTEELLRLNELLLMKFLEFLNELCGESTDRGYQPLADEIETVLINMHHLVNTFRLDQARIDVLK